MVGRYDRRLSKQWRAVVVPAGPSPRPPLSPLRGEGEERAESVPSPRCGDREKSAQSLSPLPAAGRGPG